MLSATQATAVATLPVGFAPEESGPRPVTPDAPRARAADPLATLGTPNLPMRVTRRETLVELVHNRLHPNAHDPRPLAVVAFPAHDDKGAFRPVRDHGNLDALVRGYRVLYYEVDSDLELTAAIAEATRDRPADLLVIGGHGGRLGMLFDSPLRFWSPRRYLDIFDGPKLERLHLAERLAPDATVLLHSCSSGKGREDSVNLANLVARHAPGARIFAPTTKANATYRFDEHHRLVDPGYIDGKARPLDAAGTYVING